MNVLYNTYPMAFDVPGGGEMQIMAYKKYLPEYGITPQLLNLWNPEFDMHDVVHFFSVIDGSEPFCRYVKSLGKPLVITSSIWIAEENARKYSLDGIRRILELADSIITNSNIEADTLSAFLGLPRERFVTVYNGVDDSFLIPATPELASRSFSGVDKYLLHVGTIEPRKNQLGLIRAAKKFPNHKVVLIGYARDREYTKQCLTEGGSQVLYFGPLPHDSELLRSAMAGCDAFVIPGYSETPSLASLEAGAQGARIAITKVGSAPEYFGDLVSYLNPHSVESIAESIERAISFSKGEELRKLVAEKYPWKKVLQPMADEYRRMVRR